MHAIDVRSLLLAWCLGAAGCATYHEAFIHYKDVSKVEVRQANMETGELAETYLPADGTSDKEARVGQAEGVTMTVSRAGDTLQSSGASVPWILNGVARTACTDGGVDFGRYCGIDVMHSPGGLRLTYKSTFKSEISGAMYSSTWTHLALVTPEDNIAAIQHRTEPLRDMAFMYYALGAVTAVLGIPFALADGTGFVVTGGLMIGGGLGLLWAGYYQANWPEKTWYEKGGDESARYPLSQVKTGPLGQ